MDTARSRCRAASAVIECDPILSPACRQIRYERLVAMPSARAVHHRGVGRGRLAACGFPAALACGCVRLSARSSTRR